MASINTIVKRKQYLWLGIVVELHASAAFRPHAQSLPKQLSLRREHAVNEVYVIAGGEWLRNNLNAIAAFMGTRTWDSIEKIALTLSVLAVAVMWVQRHNVMDLLGWVNSWGCRAASIRMFLPVFWRGSCRTERI